MATLHRQYVTLEVNGKKQEIKFSVSFNKDQYNWATNQRKKIGYQVSATPIERTIREDGIVIESFGAFTGFNDCLLEVERQSSKRLQQAIQELDKKLPTYLEWFKNKLQHGTIN